MISRLRVHDLALSRGGRELVTGVALELRAGEAMALTGANGSGKTTLLRAVAGLLRPDGGEVAFERASGPLDPDEARAGGLHWLGHQDGLKTTRTAGEELAFWARWSGGDARPAIDALALKPLMPLEVRKLSAGQRRRLALARLIAAPRPLWLLDEPMAPLDAATRARFGEIMADHLASGGLILAAVHDPLPIRCAVLDLGG